MLTQNANSGAGLNSSPLEGEPNFSSRKFGGGHQTRNVFNAKKMRKKLTPWELQLWQRLKAKQLNGFKFRRQQPIGPYVVDFLNTVKKLVIELDGSQHSSSYDDEIRDAYLERAGYRVLRFWNNEINSNIDGVITKILSVLEDAPHQNPQAGFGSPSRGELPSTELSSEHKVDAEENA